jgi:hypothetical protein
MTPKDVELIQKIIDTLPYKDYLKNTSHEWWPKFVFHYTNIKNVGSILPNGILLSRAQLERKNKMPSDNASPGIIGKTRTEVKEYVRCYFRPRTPTQYNNEGLRPTEQRQLGSNCPVPVFFLFDSKRFFAENDCYFSKGNMASPSCVVYNTAQDFRKLPFSKIYHDGPIQPIENSSNITFHRCAEIIVKDKVSLNSLKYLSCRSPAEKETLLFCLSSYKEVKKRWASKIMVDSKLNVFFRYWTFIESVNLGEKQVVINFSPDSRTPSPFKLYYEMVDQKTNEKYILEKEKFKAVGEFRVAVPKKVSSYWVKVKLNDELMYANNYEPTEIPF